MDIPRALKVKPVRGSSPQSYNVFIGLNPIGDVMKGKDREGTYYEFTPKHPKAPAGFKTRKMEDIKQQLAQRITRDEYMAIYDEKTAMIADDE